MQQYHSIDDIIAALETIISDSETSQSTMGYFAVLYHKVTVKVKEGIAEGFFDDGPRMEKLDIVFAERYLKAYHAYQRRQPTTASWQAAFGRSADYWYIVLQHLLLGINAHINLDLGIAAAEVAEGKEIGALKGDFDKINDILASLVHEVQASLARIWPTLVFILKKTGRMDDLVMDFSMQLAREGAWKFAAEIAAQPRAARKPLIEARDRKVAAKVRLITEPGFLVKMALRLIRLGERGAVSDKIRQLGQS